MVRIGSPYDGVLHAVLDGRADVGFVRTGVLERWRRDGKPRVDELEVVAPMVVAGFPYVTSTPVFPEWPVVVLPHLEESRARRFAQAVLALEPGSAALRQARIERVTIPADYAGVEALMRDLRLPPFDAPRPVAWNDVWQAHRLSLLVGAALVLASLLGAGFLGRSRRRHKRQALELAAAKQAADEERHRLHGILGAVRAGTWEWNVQTGELRINRHWAEMIGYRLEELEPISLDTWRGLVHPDDLDKAWAAVESHLRGETRHYDVDLRMRHKAGHWVLMHDRGEVVARDVHGEALWMCGLHIDVSDPGARPPAEARVG
jgi:PAS domain S-box-containing protein